jgi:hypothetical protein
MPNELDPKYTMDSLAKARAERYVIRTGSRMFVRVRDAQQPTLSFVADAAYATVMSHKEATRLLTLVGCEQSMTAAQPGDGISAELALPPTERAPMGAHATFIHGTRQEPGGAEYWAVVGPGVDDLHATDELDAIRLKDALTVAYRRGVNDKAREVRAVLGVKP